MCPLYFIVLRFIGAGGGDGQDPGRNPFRSLHEVDKVRENSWQNQMIILYFYRSSPTLRSSVYTYYKDYYVLRPNQLQMRLSRPHDPIELQQPVTHFLYIFRLSRPRGRKKKRKKKPGRLRRTPPPPTPRRGRKTRKTGGQGDQFTRKEL